MKERRSDLVEALKIFSTSLNQNELTRVCNLVATLEEIKELIQNQNYLTDVSTACK